MTEQGEWEIERDLDDVAVVCLDSGVGFYLDGKRVTTVGAMKKLVRLLVEND